MKSKYSPFVAVLQQKVCRIASGGSVWLNECVCQAVIVLVAIEAWQLILLRFTHYYAQQVFQNYIHHASRAEQFVCIIVVLHFLFFARNYFNSAELYI